jgi:hypothetical protein
MTRHRTAKPGADYYRTPAGTAWHGASILEAMYQPRRGNVTVVDAFAGDGALLDACKDVGFAGVGFDISPRRKDVVRLDVANLHASPLIHAGDVAICNPAYTYWREHVATLTKYFATVIALGPCTLLDSKAELPPGLDQIHFTARPRFLGDQHPMPHAWLVFTRNGCGIVSAEVCSLETRKRINEINKEHRTT